MIRFRKWLLRGLTPFGDIKLGEVRWHGDRPLVLVSVNYSLEPHAPAMVTLTYVDQVDAEDRATEGVVTT